MRQSIRGYVDAVLLMERRADPSRIGALAAEVAAVRTLLDTSEDLRRVMSDPGVAVHARRAVVTDLLSDRVSVACFQIVTYALVAGKPTEFVSDLSWLVERVSAERDGLVMEEQVMLGRTAAGERIEGFADAWLATQDEATLGEIEDELFRFRRIVLGSDELSQALSTREIPSERRAALVADLIGNRSMPATVALATYATRVGRPRDYAEQIEALVERVASERNRRIADVRSAIELDDAQRERLGRALSALTGRNTEVRVSIDRSLLGGFVATIGDTVVDGSTRHRLNRLEERLVLPEATITTTGDES